jgi:hypothetical protein
MEQVTMKLKRKLLTKPVMAGISVLMLSWLAINIAVGMGQPDNFQAKWELNKLMYKTNNCVIEREWCKNKMVNPEDYTVKELEGCAAKSKLTCDFQ